MHTPICLACFPHREEMNHKLFATAGWPRLVSTSPAVTNLPNLPPRLQSKHLSHLSCLSQVTSRKRLKCIAKEFLCVVTHAVFGLIGRDKMNQTHSVSDPIWKTSQESRPLRCLWTGRSSVSLARYVFAEYMTTFSQEGLEILMASLRIFKAYHVLKVLPSEDKLFATAGWPRLVSTSPAVTNLPNLPPRLQSKHLSHLSSLSQVTSRKRLKCIAKEFLCVLTHAVPLLGLSLNESD